MVFCCHIMWALQAHSSSSCLLGKRGTMELGSNFGLAFLEKDLNEGGPGVKLANRALSDSERQEVLRRPLVGKEEGEEVGEGGEGLEEVLRETSFLAMIAREDLYISISLALNWSMTWRKEDNLFSLSIREAGETLAKLSKVNQSLQEAINKMAGESLVIAKRSCSMINL